MNNTLLAELLRRPVAYHPALAQAFGSIGFALIWSQLFYWKDKTLDPDGWIYKSHVDWLRETGLSRKEQETARRIGKELGILEEKLCGRPATLHYRLNWEKTCEILQKYSEGIPTAPQRATPPTREKPAEPLPEWLNPKAWDVWCRYRKESGKKMTPTTQKMQWKFLEEHKETHSLIIKQSIMNGWQGLFALKIQSNDKVRNEQKKEVQREDAEMQKENAKTNDALRKLREEANLLATQKRV
jgi:hypothetical protein